MPKILFQYISVHNQRVPIVMELYFIISYLHSEHTNERILDYIIVRQVIENGYQL